MQVDVKRLTKHPTETVLSASSAFIDVLHISASAWSYVMRLVARGCADTRDPALISVSARKENLGL